MTDDLMSTTPPAPPTTPGPLPLVLGVTGHRDLRAGDTPALEKLVRDVFLELRRRHPATPLLLLSSLAEGADRLVARVALAFGARLIVPLPLPRTLYERDFTTAQSRDEFAALLARAEQVLELPLLTGNTVAAVEEAGDARDQQYALASAYVARHSQLLIALWDGVESDRTGGTSQAVHFKLDGVPEPYGPPQHPLDPVDSGPVFHVVTPRHCNPAPVGALTLRKLFPPGHESGKDAATAYRRLYQRINAFNRDAVRLGGRLAGWLARSKSWLLPDKEAERLPEPLKRFVDCFAVTDTLAIWFQRRALRSMALLLVLVFLAAFFFNAADSVRDPQNLLALRSLRLLYVAMLGGAYAILLWAWWTDYHAKYLDYRALAEGLRVQLFWRLAGLPDSVADHYLRKQRSELDWIRDAVRVWDMTLTPHPDDRLPLVVDAWVKSQRGYFAKAARRDENTLQFWKRLGTFCFLAGLAWAGVKVFLGPPHAEIDRNLKDVLLSDLLHGLVVLVSLAPVIAALFYSYTRTRALSEHAKQYSRMAQVFTAAERKVTELLQANRPAEARLLLLDLGKEALLENSDWVQVHRERPIQVPALTQTK
jgi:hypothetical protein